MKIEEIRRLDKIKKITKVCPNCKQEKHKKEFGTRLNRKYLMLNSWCKECYKIGNRSEKRKEYNHRWKRENNYGKEGLPRIKRNAKQRVIGAVKSGRLEKEPCLICGDFIVHGHHENYEKPLDVLWLCPKHHRIRHKAIRSGYAKTN